MTAEPSPAWQEVGWMSADGRVSRVYEAQEHVRCHYCLHFIRPGEYFMRPRLSPRHQVRLCVCQACGTRDDQDLLVHAEAADWAHHGSHAAAYQRAHQDHTGEAGWHG